MFISKAFAQAPEISTEMAGTAAVPAAPSTTEAFMWNMGLVLVLVVMFYVLLIRPQQRRMKEHSAMLDALKKGDKVTTSGGLVGMIDKIIDDKEMVIDLGGGTKVTVLRSYVQGKVVAANDSKPAGDAKKK